MMRHVLHVVHDATKFVNPGQVPVITAHQLLFAILKSIQKKKKPVMMSQNFLFSWVVCISRWRFRTAGVTFLTIPVGQKSCLCLVSPYEVSQIHFWTLATYLKRTRFSHEVTAATLFRLMNDAFLGSGEAATKVPRKQWIEESRKRSPTFHF